MKHLLLSFFLICNMIMGFSQINCLPLSNGAAALDLPPGCFLCESFYEGNTDGYTSDNLNYDFPCGEIENSQWFTILVGKEGVLEVSVKTRDCENLNGIELAIYDQDLNLVSECKSGINLIVVKASNLIPFEKYQILIDGIAGDVCDFELEVSGRDVFDNDMRIEPTAYGRFCLEVTACFTLKGADGADEYLWEIPNYCSVISGGARDDTEVCLRFNSIGNEELKVRPFTRCAIPNALTIPVIVANLDQTFNVQLCPDDFENHEIRDSCYVTATGCDSCLRYNVFLQTQQIFNVDTLVCSEQCIQIGDSCFSTDGPHVYRFEGAIDGGCDSVIFLSLNAVDVLPSPAMSCTSIDDDIFVEWSKPSGASSFIISINRDSFDTIDSNSLLIENVPIDSIIYLKVQPQGECSYLPAELSCGRQISGIKPKSINDKITVFPNPTNGKISLESDLKIGSVEVFDLTGRFIQIENTSSFELENPKAGIYFLKIKTKNGIAVKRFLLN